MCLHIVGAQQRLISFLVTVLSDPLTDLSVLQDQSNQLFSHPHLMPILVS